MSRISSDTRDFITTSLTFWWGVFFPLVFVFMVEKRYQLMENGVMWWLLVTHPVFTVFIWMPLSVMFWMIIPFGLYYRVKWWWGEK